MTKQELEEYGDLVAEIKELEKELAEKEKIEVADAVTSSAEFPYSPHLVSVHGVPDLSRERQRSHGKIEKLNRQKAAVEKFIEGLPTSRQRRIVRYRVLDRMTWGEIAAKMGYKYTEAGVKKIYSRIFQKK